MFGRGAGVGGLGLGVDLLEQASASGQKQNNQFSIDSIVHLSCKNLNNRERKERGENH